MKRAVLLLVFIGSSELFVWKSLWDNPQRIQTFRPQEGVLGQIFTHRKQFLVAFAQIMYVHDDYTRKDYFFRHWTAYLQALMVGCQNF